MADTALSSTASTKAQLIEANKQREALRARLKEDKVKERKERKAEIAEQKKKNKALLKQIKGPDLEQIGGDLAGLVIGEGGFRLLQLALTKVGATSALWYTALPGLLGTVLYSVTYPRKDEGLIRSALRATGLYWQIVGLHDGLSVVINGGQKRAEEVAAQQREIVALQQQLAAARQPAK